MPFLEAVLCTGAFGGSSAFQILRPGGRWRSSRPCSSRPERRNFLCLDLSVTRTLALRIPGPMRPNGATNGPKMCPCGHHEGYHDDDGECMHRVDCGCQGLPPECLTPLEEV